MFAKLSDGAIEWLDGAVRAGEHHTAFHGDEDESREGIDVGTARHGGFHRDQAFAHGIDPSLKIAGDEGVSWSVFGIDLESETAERAAVLAAGGENAFAIAGQNREDAFEGFGR